MWTTVGCCCSMARPGFGPPLFADTRLSCPLGFDSDILPHFETSSRRGSCLCSAHGTCGPPPPQSGQHQIAPGTLSVLACRFLRIPLNSSRGVNTFLTDGIGCSPGGALWRDVAGLVLNQTWRIGVEPQLSRLHTVPWPIPDWKREEKGSDPSV